MAVVAGFANFPFGVLGDGFTLRFEHYRRAHRRLLPDASTAVEFSSGHRR